MLAAEKHVTGFSLTELLVGMVIALITTTAIFQVFSTYQAQKQGATSESDAVQSGNLAVYLLSTELKKAGAGINTNRIYPYPANLNGELTTPIMPLYGCQMSIAPVEHSKTIENVDVPATDRFQANMEGSFRGFEIFKKINGKSTIPLAPLLIRENTATSEIGVGDNLKQDILVSMASTNAMPGVAPICNVKPGNPATQGNSPREKADYELKALQDVTDCTGGDEGSFVTLGYYTTKTETLIDGVTQKEVVQLKPIPRRGIPTTPIGFCSTTGLRWDQHGYNWGSMCYETILAVSPDFKQCTLTTTGAYTTTDNKPHGWQAQLWPGDNGKNPQEKERRNAGTMDTPLLSLQSNLMGNTYGGGYIMSLGRLDNKNIRSEEDDFVRDGRYPVRDENLRPSGFALFTVGKDGQGGTGKSSLLRYDIVQNRLEVLADNIVLIKAIYGLAGERDEDGDKIRDASLRNIYEKASKQNWMNPTTTGWRYEDLTAGDANGVTDVARQRLRRIRAVKVALVARSAFPDEEPLDGDFKIKLFQKELGNNAITVSLNDEARKYRYEVFEFIVPLQNSQYGFDQAYASCFSNNPNDPAKCND